MSLHRTWLLYFIIDLEFFKYYTDEYANIKIECTYPTYKLFARDIGYCGTNAWFYCDRMEMHFLLGLFGEVPI